MKPSRIVPVLLCAAPGLAAAQSVTLYGTVDVSARYVKADGQRRRLSEATDGLNSSQLAFRGVEDLGSGLKAGFTLLAGVNADTGTTNTKFFNRRSTVSLFSPFGELRLGRDYVPTFWNIASNDPFGIVGIASTANERQMYSGATRMDNSIGYFLPANLAGVYGQAMVSASEGGGTLDRPGRYIGGRLGYSAGGLDIALAASGLRFVSPSAQGSIGLTGTNVVVNAIPGQTQKTYNVGASYDFKVVKLMGSYDVDKLQSYRENAAAIGAQIPIGTSEIHVGYDRSKLKRPNGVATTVDQYKAGVVYNLSKRTAVYATASRLTNKDGTRLTLPSASGQTNLGGKSTGAEAGIRHFF